MKKLLPFIIALLPVFGYSQTDSVLVLSDVHIDLRKPFDTFYHIDTDPRVFLSAAANAKAGKYSFIIMPGDLLRHTTKAENDTHDVADMKLSYKYVIKNIKAIDKRAIILPALGNNDCIAHNIPNAATYKVFYDALLKRIDRGGRIKKSFLAGGYYAYEKDSLAIIILNTVLFMRENDSLAIEAKAELVWLKEKLQSLKPGQSAWLVYHVPPGIDRYGKTPSWQDSIQATYLQIIKQYAPRIKLQLAGHTHMVDARLLVDSGKLLSYIAIAPGLDSRNGNNPAYQVLHYNQSDKRASQITTWYTDALSNYAWHSFAFKNLDFGFFKDGSSDNSLGLDFIRHYTTCRGATQAKDKTAIAWDDTFRGISTIKIPD